MNSRTILITLECFVHKDGKYLMLHRNPDKKIMPDVWMAPGGKIELGEGLFEAARREILEETGLEIKNLRLKSLGNGYLKDLNTQIYFHFVFSEYASGKVKQNPENGELVWLTPKEIVKLDNILQEIPKIAKYIFDGTDTVVSYKVVYDKGNHMTEFELESIE